METHRVSCSIGKPIVHALDYTFSEFITQIHFLEVCDTSCYARATFGEITSNKLPSKLPGNVPTKTRQTALEQRPPSPVNVTSENVGSPSCHETCDFPTNFPFSIIAERRFVIIRRFGCRSACSTHESENCSCFLIVNKRTKTTLSRSVSLLPPTMRDV